MIKVLRPNLIERIFPSRISAQVLLLLIPTNFEAACIEYASGFKVGGVTERIIVSVAASTGRA